MTNSSSDKQQRQSEAKERSSNHASDRAAWNVPEWCAALGLGRSTYYILEIRPRSIKIGKRLLIVEAPADYAARIAQMQAAA